MATACSYTPYELPIHQQHHRTIHPDTKVPSVSTSAAPLRSVTVAPTLIKDHHHHHHHSRPKDFTRPLHVDCSVEYELPNQAKPPQGVQNEPLLMIHPCYFRKIESQRHSLFVNNMPTGTTAGNKLSISGTSPRGGTNIGGGASRSQYPLVQPDVSQLAATPFQRAQERYDDHPQLWEPQQLPPVPTNYRCLNADTTVGMNARWAASTPTAADLSSCSPDRPEIRMGKQRHHGDATVSATGKYRQYLRPRRLHPYDVASNSIPVASIFPNHHHHHQHATNQIHQRVVCYNV